MKNKINILKNVMRRYTIVRTSLNIMHAHLLMNLEVRMTF